jgi:hypothetical protein
MNNIVQLHQGLVTTYGETNCLDALQIVMLDIEHMPWMVVSNYGRDEQIFCDGVSLSPSRDEERTHFDDLGEFLQDLAIAYLVAKKLKEWSAVTTQ